jgi:hypothetical protein
MSYVDLAAAQASATASAMGGGREEEGLGVPGAAAMRGRGRWEENGAEGRRRRHGRRTAQWALGGRETEFNGIDMKIWVRNQ